MPFEIPESWCWCTLSELCIFLSRGKSPKYSEERLFPVFAQKCNLKDGGISLDQARFLDPSTIEKWGDDYKLKSGDVLVNSTGTGTVGRTRLFDECCLGEYPFVVPDSHVSVVRTATEIDSFYIWAILSSNWGQQYIEDNLAGSTNQKELYIGVLEDMFIPLPPKNEQKKIAKEIARWGKYVDNIDVVKAELSNYVKQTKSKILDLAISGKLVPQELDDEPAIELLKRINPGFKPCDNSHYGNLPFELPDGWCWATLGSIGKWQSGATPNRMRKDYYGGDIPWLKTGDLNDWYITDIPEYITQQALNETSVKLNPAGSILIAMYGATIGKIGILTMPATTNQACCACISHNGIEQMYLFYYLLSHKEEFVRQGGGGAQPNISKEKIVETLIPIPPLSEQLRIIKAIEAIFNKIDNITAELS